MNNQRAALALITIVVCGAASAEDGWPSHFACTFETGTSWTYESGTFQSAPPSKLTFEVAKIDFEGQSAELLMTDNGIGKLRIVRALNANHFLEVANEGFLNLTTIYDRDPVSKVFPAVHSRHFGLLGQPVFAQYAGTCFEKDAK